MYSSNFFLNSLTLFSLIKIFFFIIKVLKPRPDHTVQLEKPRTAHFCGSFSLKNLSMGKKQGSVRITIGPHGSENHEWFYRFSRFLFFFSKYRLKLKIWPACTLDSFSNLEPKDLWQKKKKKRKKEKRKKQIEKKKMTK